MRLVNCHQRFYSHLLPLDRWCHDVVGVCLLHFSNSILEICFSFYSPCVFLHRQQIFQFFLNYTKYKSLTVRTLDQLCKSMFSIDENRKNHTKVKQKIKEVIQFGLEVLFFYEVCDNALSPQRAKGGQRLGDLYLINLIHLERN